MTEKPDIYGLAGQAWRNTIPPEQLAKGHIAGWTVFAEGSHPLWPWVNVSVIHLRDLPNVPKATVRLPGATHELFVTAIDPASYPPDVRSVHLRLLYPVNYVGQFVARNDADAINEVERRAIKPIVHGYLNPDSDGVQQWIKEFGDDCVKK